MILRRVVAGFQGLFAIGCAALIARLLGSGVASAPIFVLAGGLGLLGALAIWAAIAMWQGKPSGAVLTLALQTVHLVYIETASLTIAISLPLAVVVGFGPLLHPHSWLGWKPSIEITFHSLDPSPWVGVNLIALLSAVVAGHELWRALAKAEAAAKSPTA